MLSTTSTSSLQSETVARAALSLRVDSSSSLRLQQGTWNRASVQARFLLAMQELWLLPCIDLSCSQFPSARRSLTPLFVSVPCGDRISPGSLQSRQSPGSSPSPLPSSPPSQEKLNSGYPSFTCSIGRKLPIFLEFWAYAIPKRDLHVLVECPGLAQLLKALQLRDQVSGAVSLLWLRRAACRRVSSRPSSPRPCGQSFHTCRVSWERCHRPLPPLPGRTVSAPTGDCLQRKLWKGTFRKVCTTWKASPFLLVAELSDLAPQVFHETATVFLARLPSQHRRPTSGKVVEVRV